MYKFKFTTLLLLMITFCFAVSAQDIKERARFIIRDARVNKVDYSAHSIEQRQFLWIYSRNGEEGLYFGNVMQKDNTITYGKMFDVKTEFKDATANSYQTDTWSFKWSYANSYDDKEGTAEVSLRVQHKPAGSSFECVIMTEDLNVIIYKGYIAGSLNTTGGKGK